MVRTTRGIRNRTRQILRKSPRQRGLSPITHHFRTFEVGDLAAVVIDPSVHRGMPHRRFHGLTGRIVGKRGVAYLVDLKVGNKHKTIVAYPDHLKKVQ